ncbi:MAG: butyrate kinase [Ignavibacteria bacterium]|mgnify:FL=1
MEAVVVVNPGSTSTKVAITDGEQIVRSETLRHDVATLNAFGTIWEQYPFRLEAVRTWAAQHVERCMAVVARGGLLKPVEGGTYLVTDAMLEDARKNLQGEHAANLGCAIAYELAREYACSAFIVDPVSAYEFEPLAKYSGLPQIERRSLSHALNIHATARRAAEQLGKPLHETRFVVCHLGSGISIAPLRGGKIIDVNDASSDGPYAPERSGGLPLQQFITLCFSGTYSERELRDLVRARGGLLAYLGTNDVREVERRIEQGDSYAREVYEAMAYQIAKEIGAMATVLHGDVHAIVMTGSAAHSRLLTSWIGERVRFIAPVLMFPGEDEMIALALGALRVLRGVEEAKRYE